ncbi:hypothetical protein WQQ_45840 [Hydrocarboniphaga effusa AP103]|uniref:Uncharacterized protein n=1 Tax=Hydrocarboniphaga effusa AP103 TaxID=1172194 RepID=I7Z8K2_9GAMM|nr:hypothetical protein WQQ_45840 [Hydrocarboniphaga effusa AP103]
MQGNQVGLPQIANSVRQKRASVEQGSHADVLLASGLRVRLFTEWRRHAPSVAPA